MFLFRRRNYAPLSQTCTAGACACSCKSRRAPRPRKPDEKLSRHGLGARRVALLAPRGDLDQYRYPLGYVGAITKNFGKVQKSVPHFGRRELYSEWGRSPGGEEGVSYSHVRGRQLVYSLNTTLTPSEHPRDEQHIRSPPEHAALSKRVSPLLSPSGTRAKTIKKRARLGARFSLFRQNAEFICRFCVHQPAFLLRALRGRGRTRWRRGER